MVRFEVEEFLVTFDQCEQACAEGGFRAWARVSTEARDEQREFGYHNRTGALSAGMTALTQRTSLFGYKSDIQTAAPYALFVDEKTRPHFIHARRARALRFVIAGVVHFRRWVYHPGWRGAWFRKHAGTYFELEAPREVQAAIDDAVGRN